MNFKQRMLSVAETQYLNRWLVFSGDLLLAGFSTLLSMAIAAYFFYSTYILLAVLKIFSVSILCSAIAFWVFQSYKGIIRHSAFTEVGRIALVSIVKVGLLAGSIRLIDISIPPVEMFLMLLLDVLLTFFLLSFLRAILIYTYNMVLDRSLYGRERMLIFVNQSNLHPISASGIVPLLGKEGFRVLGYLSFSTARGVRIEGLPLYTIRDEFDFARMVHALRIRSILFEERLLVKHEKERLVRFCEKNEVKMYIQPSVDEIQAGKIHRHNLPEVRVEDLLEREEIVINLAEIASALEGKVVMVTGAAGSIGSELCRQLCSFGLKELILFDSAETPMHNIRLELEEKFPSVHFEPIMGDIRMKERVDMVFDRYRPQLVFHAAAYKHVPLMEENACEAVHTNVYGTQIVADASVKYGVDKFVMISTDKAVNPTNVMGASKRLAEIYVQSLSMAIREGQVSGHTRFITTRFGNVLGSNGSVIPRFREQLAKGGPLTVTHPDIIRYFMTIPEACRLVLEAAFMGKGDEIFVFDMGTPVKIDRLARRMIEMAGLTPGKDIDIQYTGLRPGEKLYEELLAEKEQTIPTDNPKIFRAKVRIYDFEEIRCSIHQLTELAVRVERKETVRMMKQIVPEFKSKNSIYEQLDH